MSYQKHNFEAGAVLFASQLNDMDNQIEYLSNQGSSFSDDFKTALLNCFENVAWINENGQTYYDALYDSLYPDNMWFITNILTGCATSNNATSILKNNSYVATITASEGYTLDGATVSITMGGNDVTNLYYSSGSINIPNVTGNLVITVTATSAVASISAVFTQGQAVIYPSTSLNTLRQYLVVTAIYVDTTTETVTDYTLSGTLEEGTSTITVNYGGKTDTFTVTVSPEAGYVTSGLIHRWDGIDNTSSGHSSSTTTWEDLVGSVDLTKTGGTWNSNSLALSAANTQDIVYSDSLESITDATIEICFKYTGSTATAFAVFNPESGTGSRNARRFCLYTDNTIGGIASSGNTYTNTEQTIGDIRNISINYTDLTVNAMYVNGLVATLSSNSHSFQYSGSKQMSLGGAGNSYKFYGEIYSIRIYNRVLTATEVAQNYAYDLQRFELGSA